VTRRGRRVDGVLLLDKPAGISSNAALQRARRLLDAAKAGHTGTLDPLASGLLPVCFGDATKFAQLLLDAPKEYVATLRIGTATSTGDAEGEPIAHGPSTVAADVLERVLHAFVGESLQTPPRHAALKYQGRKLYDYARAGIEVPRTARPVRIERLVVERYAPGEPVLRVACSKGTYVRVLVEDIARAAGTVGHLSALRRTASGPFRIEQAITLDAFEDLGVAERAAHLLPADAPLGALPRVDLDPAAALAVTHGQVVTSEAPPAERARAYDPAGRFMGVVRIGEGRLRVCRLVRSDPAGNPDGNAGTGVLG
jgi:tRNA pseudouridine55 synthase